MNRETSTPKDSPASDAQQGERDGRACRRCGRKIPSLSGGAYAVGFLYGYTAEAKRPVGRSSISD